MRVLKAMLVVACVASAVSVFRPTVPKLGSLGTLLSVINIVMFGGAFYGIHRRAALMWRVGFAIIVALGVQFLMQSLILTWNSTDKAAVAQIQAGFLVIATLAVTTYWLFWWKLQKPFFTNGSSNFR